MTKSVLLYSGGLDSLIAWFYLNKPDSLYINLHHRYSKKELSAIEKLPPVPEVLDSYYGLYFEKEDAHIPGRNLILGMFAAAKGYDRIYLVAQKGEQSIPDRSPSFFNATSHILSFHFEKEVIMSNPFPYMTKTEMVKWYVNADLPVRYLIDSISCYSSENGQCGQCGSCFRKFVSLEINGIKCSHIFNNNIKKWGIDNYGHRLDAYPEYRSDDIRKIIAG